jgi:hypothetical protein
VSASYIARPRPLWQSPAQTRPAVRRARRAEATASLDYCARDIVLDTDGLTLLEAHSYRTIFNRVPVTGKRIGQVGAMRSVIAMPAVFKGLFNSGAAGL